MMSSATRGPEAARRSPQILILKLVALGDIVMASTLVGAVRRRWPDARLTWVTGRGFESLVRRFDGVDAVRAVDAGRLLSGGLIGRALAAVIAARTIGGPYDIALVGHSDSRYERLLTFSRVREIRALRDGAVARAPRKGVWAGADYARLVADDGGDADVPRLATLAWPQGRPARAEGGEVLLAPGGARNVLRDDHLRRWPAERWGELAAQLVAAGVRVTLIGSAGDAAECAAVVRAATVRDLVGRLTLDETLELLATSNLLVSHDSGPLHLAQLVGTPVVALFGPTEPVMRIAPGADVAVASAAAGLACAPCYDGRNYAVCGLNRCLTDVGVERVAAMVLNRVTRIALMGAEGLAPPDLCCVKAAL